jgi:hypothetical protein
MTTTQEIKLNMYLAVRNFIIQNDSAVKTVPKLPSIYANLESTITQIQSIGEQQKDVKTGFAKDKKRLRETLITIAGDNSRKLAAIAKFAKNETLMDKVRFTISELKRMTDVALKDYAMIIYDKVESNLDKLAEYENTPDTQKVFLETIKSYNAALSTPRSGIAEKKQATQRLVVLFSEADVIIEEMDYAINAVQLKNPDFINGYRTVRRLVDTGAGNLALIGTAWDNSNGFPVKGVRFVFRPDGGQLTSGGNTEIIKKTAEKGSFYIKNIPAGTYKVSVSKPGYKDKEVTVSVADGERSELVVEMEKG